MGVGNTNVSFSFKSKVTINVGLVLGPGRPWPRRVGAKGMRSSRWSPRWFFPKGQGYFASWMVQESLPLSVCSGKGLPVPSIQKHVSSLLCVFFFLLY